MKTHTWILGLCLAAMAAGCAPGQSNSAQDVEAEEKNRKAHEYCTAKGYDFGGKEYDQCMSDQL